ncbi:MAG: hypothetical protein DRP08_02260 [Candidatus Aenigmatarchaeota archaeon]|nr:MAG: hypothetical protein DRP08_02260 [Candidatus Aenigmarchaeota archaeon]
MINKYEGVITAMAPIVHFGNEKTGSTPILRTIMLYYEEIDEYVPVPYINGNAIRGRLRRLLMKDFFDNINVDTKQLPIKLYHIFFTGGALESTEETTGFIDLELRRQIRELIVPLSVLGCAIGNQMIPGKLKVGHAWPICKEYKQYLPPLLQNNPRAEMPVRTFTDEAFHTRKDDLKAERTEDEQAMQMKVDYECFIPGTQFYHWWALEFANDVEKSCFGRIIELWSVSPYIGGKTATGDGLVKFEYQPLIPSSKIYLDFLKNKADDIAKLLAILGQVK